ncbi:MAG: hypothetical protein QW548_03200 [Candidatus Aenigmatarchaeota archaeon]
MRYEKEETMPSAPDAQSAHERGHGASYGLDCRLREALAAYDASSEVGRPLSEMMLPEEHAA